MASTNESAHQSLKEQLRATILEHGVIRARLGKLDVKHKILEDKLEAKKATLIALREAAQKDPEQKDLEEYMVMIANILKPSSTKYYSMV